MHRLVDWMVPADRPILQVLDSQNGLDPNRPLRLQPGNIAENVGYGRTHVSRRLQLLAEYRLVERHDRAFYSITELGVQAIAREIDPDEMNALDREPIDEEDGNDPTPP